MEDHGKKLMAKYSTGHLVVLKSDKTIRGVILDVNETGIEPKYRAFVNNEIKTWYESQILLFEEEKKEVKRVSKAVFDAALTCRLLKSPTNSSLYSLNTARIDYIPHQFRPVVKFVQSDNQRILIADGVGVGKTIEAGLVLKELEAREDIDSVLVICPKPLVSERKWEDEMKRFGEEFTALDGQKFRYCLKEMDMEGEWPAKYRKCILPYSLFDKTSVDGGSEKYPGLESVPAPQFDLVIVDEAHHIRNTATYAYRAVEKFTESAESVVFLTATPVQLEQDDLFVLLGLLDPDVFYDRDVFHEMAEPNQYISRASAVVRKQGDGWKEEALDLMYKACATAWGRNVISGNPKTAEVLNLLKQETISGEERVQLIADIEDLHTFSRIINRTRRRDIGRFTIRKPYTVSVPFTPAQIELHEQILSVIADMFNRRFPSQSIKFLMTTIRRQAASCLFGLVPFLHDILYRNYIEMVDEGYDINVVDGETDEDLKQRIEAIIALAKQLPPEDPKIEELEKIVRAKTKEKKNKILIFSSFIHTLDYIYNRLKKDGYRVGMVTGKTDDETRISLRERFNPAVTPNESEHAIDILLMSEVGCEGLDYQFCDCMINYDLPWNPMRIEQRIGRIDRNGQTSESVSIYNMITPDTVDADIYERCMMRIGVFQDSIGDCEGILGQVTGEIQDIASNFRLSEEERREKLQQLADNEIRKVREEEELEEKQKSLFGISLPGSTFDEELKKCTNCWLSPEMTESLCNVYLNNAAGTADRNFFIGEHEEKLLRLGKEAKQRILEVFRKAKFTKTPQTRLFEQWLKTTDQHLPVTFSNVYAKEHLDTALIDLTHPLVKLAVSSMDEDSNVICTLKVHTDEVKPGSYPFLMYQWSFSGVKKDTKLKAVSDSAELNERLLDLLEQSEACTDDTVFHEEDYKDIEKAQYSLWKKEKDAYVNQTLQTIAYKEESLKAGHNKMMSQLRERLSKATDTFDRKMTQARIDKRENQFDINMKKLEDAKDKADIESTQIAYGRLIIEPK